MAKPHVGDKIAGKIDNGLELTTLETWMSGMNAPLEDGPDWVDPLASVLDAEGKNRLFESGKAGSNGEAVDGYYSLNMRGLAKTLLSLGSTSETTESEPETRDRGRVTC